MWYESSKSFFEFTKMKISWPNFQIFEGGVEIAAEIYLNLYWSKHRKKNSQKRTYNNFIYGK